MSKFTSTDTLPRDVRSACNRALHAAHLPTMGSARTVEDYLVSSLGSARTVASALRPVGLVVPRSRGAHAA